VSDLTGRRASLRRVRVALLTREYPPEVYGGAGVHVEYLARSLRPLVELTVQCFGADRDEPGVMAHSPPATLAGANAALQTMGVDLAMADAVGPGEGRAAADLVHSHTWYANLAGHVASLLHGIPHVATVHSLEPLRPWKAEQLGGGYALSSWCERVALESAARVIAVSAGMRDDVLAAYPGVDPARVSVVHNGIDPDDYAPSGGDSGPGADPATAALLARIGVDPGRPAVVFVGRITRQKGLPVLLKAAAGLPADAQLVLLAGAAHTPSLAAEVVALVDGLRATRTGVVWVQEMLPRADVARVLGACTVFVCPSVYEPLGIVNLEAMACGIPVVASAVGGIPEVVDDGVTGLLVPPDAPDALAQALTAVLADPARGAAMGAAGRRRAVEHFSWSEVAGQTAELYREVLASSDLRVTA
jgi:starch synthase